MILYSQDELQIFVYSLGTSSIVGSNIPVVHIRVGGCHKYIDGPSLLKILQIKDTLKFNFASIGILKYMYNYAECTITLQEESKLYDVFYKFELNRVPLFLNEFPEVANWRLRIGK
jgi:hypothetical protein